MTSLPKNGLKRKWPSEAIGGGPTIELKSPPKKRDVIEHSYTPHAGLFPKVRGNGGSSSSVR